MLSRICRDDFKCDGGKSTLKVVAFATIKMNSQRVPHKNILPIGSKPLCYHILETAKKVNAIDEVYVYCSDDNITQYIPNDVTFLKRDVRLDGDAILAKDTYTAFINDVPDADYYIALCTTSPFTKVETLENALNEVLSGRYDSAFTAEKHQTFAWYKGEPINYDPACVPRTQDMQPVYIETSAFFIFSKELWKKDGRRIGFNPYIATVDSIEAVDIDTWDDYNFAQIIANNVLKI